jgi:hypothetical protein
MGAKLSSALSMRATSRDSRCAGAIETETGLPGDAWQAHGVELPDSTRDCVLFFSIAAIWHPVAQHMEDFAFSWHGIAPNIGAAPRTTKSNAATTLEKNLMPV